MNRHGWPIVAAVWLLTASGASSQLTDGVTSPRVLSSEAPRYPALAMLAGIQGAVTIQFELKATGETHDVHAVTGHPLLIPAAVDAVKSWRFKWGDREQLHRVYQTLVVFRLSDKVRTYTVQMPSFRAVRVLAPLPVVTGRREEGCPVAEMAPPPPGAPSEDYIEMSRSGCKVSCPAYTVRVFRGGKVEWTGIESVKVRGERHAKIDPDAAAQLVERFRSVRFWSLCEVYADTPTGQEGVGLTARIGGREKPVVDYAGSGPAWLREMAQGVDEVADTARWRQGARKVGP